MTKVQQVLSTNIKTINQSINNIERGGCLVFASKLQAELANHGIVSSIHVVVTAPYQCKQMIDDMIETVGGSDISDAYIKISKKDVAHNPMLQCVYQFPHCAVMVDGKLYDNNGEVSKERCISHHLEPLAVKALLNKKDVWNELFRNSNPSLTALDLDYAIEVQIKQILKALD